MKKRLTEQQIALALRQMVTGVFWLFGVFCDTYL